MPLIYQCRRLSRQLDLVYVVALGTIMAKHHHTVRTYGLMCFSHVHLLYAQMACGIITLLIKQSQPNLIA